MKIGTQKQRKRRLARYPQKQQAIQFEFKVSDSVDDHDQGYHGYHGYYDGHRFYACKDGGFDCPFCFSFFSSYPTSSEGLSWDALNLVLQGGVSSVSALVPFLFHPSDSVHKVALEALVGMGDHGKEVVSSLVQALQREEGWIRVRAVKALDEIGESAKEVISAFLQVLQDPFSLVRVHAAEALLKRGNDAREAVPALLPALQEQDKDIRTHAVRVLGRMKNDAVVVPLLVQASQDQDDDVRVCAAEALGGWAESSKEAVPALLLALQDRSERVRICAAEALGGLEKHTKEAARSLVQALNDQEWRVTVCAAKALGRMRDFAKEAAPALALAFLQNLDRWGGECVLEALVEMGESAKEAVPFLVQVLLHHRFAHIRAGAEVAWSKMCWEAKVKGLWALDLEERVALCRLDLSGRESLAVACGVFGAEQESLVLGQLKRWEEEFGQHNPSQEKWEEMCWVLWGLNAYFQERLGGDQRSEQEAWKQTLDEPLERLRSVVGEHHNEEHTSTFLGILAALRQTLQADAESDDARQAQLRVFEAPLFD